MQSRAAIIATLGPASRAEATLAAMIDAGLDIARLNFSHGTHETAAAYAGALRSAAKTKGVRIPIIQDLSGPRMTTASGHALDTTLDVITEKDLRDLDFGIAQGFEYVAQSYVGNGADVERMRGEIRKRGASTPIIAKIERKEAVQNFDEILAAADAVMVARGDLGLSVPIEDIPFIERDIAKKARAAKKPCIVATQMLYTMTENELPTRAEVTDVAFAILSVADAVMLSEETALGKHPVEAVAIMERIVLRAERDVASDVTPL